MRVGWPFPRRGFSRVLTQNKCMQWTANSAAQIANGFANFTAICTTPFAAIDAGVSKDVAYMEERSENRKKVLLMFGYLLSVSGLIVVALAYMNQYGYILIGFGMLFFSYCTNPRFLGVNAQLVKPNSKQKIFSSLGIAFLVVGTFIGFLHKVFGVGRCKTAVSVPRRESSVSMQSLTRRSQGRERIVM